ncbi:MAG: nucleotidyltransferase domain-containing protein [Candidatus Korarchaeota archaeon]|nr:nucleotidyltransferase domain-containing protein [Candidatus Korarchaeota archaeon]
MGEREHREAALIRRRREEVSSYEKLFNKFIEALKRRYPSCTIILFGSRAAERHRSSSDFDVIVVMEGDFDEVEVAAEISRLRPRGIPVDLLVINKDSLGRKDVKILLEHSKVIYDGLGVFESGNPR